VRAIYFIYFTSNACAPSILSRYDASCLTM
jgi:hypothetical protein